MRVRGDKRHCASPALVYLEFAHNIPVRVQKQGGYALVGDENGFCLPLPCQLPTTEQRRNAKRVGVSCNGGKTDDATQVASK